LKNTSLIESSQIVFGSVSNETWLFVNRANPSPLSQPAIEIAISTIYPSYEDKVNLAYPNNIGYLGDQKKRFVQMTTDSFFTCPLISIYKNASGSNSNVYRYFFDAPWVGSADDSLGDFCNSMVCHGTDLIYLLKDPALGNIFFSQYQMNSKTFQRLLDHSYIAFLLIHR
jgi:carboxylesterase type B